MKKKFYKTNQIEVPINAIVIAKSKHHALTAEQKANLAELYDDAMVRLDHALYFINKLENHGDFKNKPDNPPNHEQTTTDPEIAFTLKMIKRHFFSEFANNRDDILKVISQIKNNILLVANGLSGKLNIAVQFLENLDSHSNLVSDGNAIAKYILTSEGNKPIFIFIPTNKNKPKLINLSEVPHLEESIQHYLNNHEDKIKALKKAVKDKNIIKLITLYHIKHHAEDSIGKVYLANISIQKQREMVRGYIKHKSRNIYLNYNLINSASMSRTLLHEAAHLYANLHDHAYYHGKKPIKYSPALIRPFPEKFLNYSSQKQQELSLDNADSFAYFIYDLTGTTQYRPALAPSNYEKMVDGLSFFCNKRNALIATAGAYMITRAML